MSGGHKESPQDNAHRAGPVVNFTNPLMSDLESDWSPLHDAAFNGHILTLHGLVAQVNLPTVDGKTPLSEACAQGHLTCVSLLLQNGATSTGTGMSDSPIHKAAAKGHPECIETLVKHGADVDQRFEQSDSPLHIACINQQLNTVKKLLQLGAAVNCSVAGDSPLHVAARLSSPEMVSVLLEHGADGSLRNPAGKRPLDLAAPNSPAERLLGNNRGVPCLMQLCRLYIRKTVGKKRIGGIHGLHVPTQLKRYLLYQSVTLGDLIHYQPMAEKPF
ncbi:ankyrin repeat and SOCS box protein 9-like isoform X2 [Lampris incognitus]|uniref:ankyrin repeat and SOCS box protein 9-like isoform X2 n=1 Tax=Lampris incognitus TaxID=2546036 RepID=UPI0024B5AAE1|nr:ankyrin repeat and SOCS box protein 9-like isoform X2 [Lampris incognitus]